MIKKGTILICNEEIGDTTIGKEYLVIKDDTIEDDDGCERYMKCHVEDGSFSIKSLKIGDTFEYNGFVCEVKEEIKKWYKSENAYVRTEPMKAEGWTEITNKEFIKQLEENVR